MNEEKDHKDLEEFRDLLKNKRYSDLREKAAEMNEPDVAAVLEMMEDEDMLKMFRLFPKGLAADVFSLLEQDSQQYIITSLSDKEAGSIIDNLYADDAADLLEEMPANVVKKLLANANPETRKDINHLLRYPEESAGSIMTTEFMDLKEDMTAAQAFTRIRQKGVDSETVNVLYVLSSKRVLLGTVGLRHLIMMPEDARVGDFMHEEVVSCTTSEDQETVAQIFKKYDFTALPVVDNENRMVGIITVDDVIDIMEEEATEDIEKMAAITPSEKPYLKTGILDTVKARLPWLLLLMVSATFTGQIISSFESALAAVTILTAYIPMLMDTGGNAGSQASVTIIRGISLDEISIHNLKAVIWKEMRVALAIGVTLAACNFAKLMLIDRGLFHNPITVYVALVICLTLIVTVFAAKLVGCTLPIIAKQLGFDPAVMASPFITTIVDAISLLIYFRFATILLGL
ncbi:MAG: magnesium transporter [Solobacterium sp.]|nr:magnesium transporter [Solobacterium sp.]MBQ1356047.1 magnesium transporter [Solobacterium sp.]